jgi:hypothetical protein
MITDHSDIRRFIFVITVIFIVSPSSLLSQPKQGLYGLSTTISKGFVSSQSISTNSGSLNIGMAYMPSDHINLRGELGFRSQKDTSGAKDSEFTFTANAWYYLQTSESVSTFLGGTIGFGSANVSSGDGTSLFNLGGFFGAEYWFSSHFSCFGHIGLMYSSYLVATKPASDVFTSATTGLTWYF